MAQELVDYMTSPCGDMSTIYYYLAWRSSTCNLVRNASFSDVCALSSRKKQKEQTAFSVPKKSAKRKSVKSVDKD